jgi:CubicO group peptidase (beta-lactamase class C family)
LTQQIWSVQSQPPERDSIETALCGSGVQDLAEALDRLAASTRFSGVVRVDRDNEIVIARAYGQARRGDEVAATLDCRFGIASGTKGLTALTVASLLEQGVLELTTTARSLLGADLPLIDDHVTVEQLLAHRSGIGDYLDEDAGQPIDAYVLTVPVHELASTEDYLRVLDGHPAKSAPGECFTYNNSGYVVLALLAERATGAPFYDLVAQRVCEPAGMHDTAFLRSDELPARTAIGYLAVDGCRGNVLHLPVRGSGDGGCYSTAADVHAFWHAFFGGRIVSPEWVAELVRPRSEDPGRSRRYGLGFWLHASSRTVMLEGSDPGVSFRSVHDPIARVTYTVLSNTSTGAWPISRHLARLLAY